MVGMEASESPIIEKAADLAESRVPGKEGVSFALKAISLEFCEPLLVDAK